MSKLQRKKNKAAARGVYVYQFMHHKGWDVIVDSEYCPRGLQLTKREAVNLAYAISICKRHKLVVTYN